MPIKAKVYVGLLTAAGLSLLGWQIAHWDSSSVARFVVYLVITAFAAVLKIPLPGITGTMSVYFLFLLIAITQLALPEVVILAASAALVQSFWHAKQRPKIEQLLFNLAANALAVGSSYLVFHWDLLKGPELGMPIQLAAMAIVFFVTNTGPVAIVIALTEGKTASRVWHDCYFWCFPYYLLGASIAALFKFVSEWVGWQTALLILPVIYVIYGYYRMYLGRLEDEKNHAKQMAALHLRTIEALALAIDAKDQTTHEHLQRVQVYAIEIAKELRLEPDEMEALEAAALLHDIGKLAVPEHIINKPGKLTPEEFEKMKIHPIVGAEILQRVEFPYPVVPIVRSHHEKWDGSGYPDGLKAEKIPMGARILAAVDCLDALASDRQYRRALPLDEAIKVVEGQAGKSFDPKIVEILVRRYRELEKMARSSGRRTELAKLSTDVRVERGEAPAAGFEQATAPQLPPVSSDFLNSIAAARQEAQALFELAQTLGSSLSLHDTLSVLAGRLTKLVPYDTVAVYIMKDGKLLPEYVAGEDARLFLALQIPVGQGLSGYVADNRKPIVNGSPSVEAGYLNDPKVFSKLNSALAVPLETPDGAVVGVLTLYSAERDAFSRDQLRILQAVSSKLSVSVGNAMRFQQAESSATTDYLTSLPNARSLFMHLDSELARCHRNGSTLVVVVCDLDGFKAVNDRFGHLAGNEVLSQVAAGLRAHCREYDYVARMGGDEFVLILPGVTPELVSERLISFESVAVEVGKKVTGEQILSLSAGLAYHPKDGKSAEDLLAEADRQMYRHKQERKRVRSMMNLAGFPATATPLRIQ